MEVVDDSIQCMGRTGTARGAIWARVEKRPDGSMFVRVDDGNNLEFWLELTIPADLVIAQPPLTHDDE